MSHSELNGHGIGFGHVATTMRDLNFLPHRLKFFFVDNQRVESRPYVTENKSSAIVGSRQYFAGRRSRQTNSYSHVDRISRRRENCTHDKIITSESRIGRFG